MLKFAPLNCAALALVLYLALDCNAVPLYQPPEDDAAPTHYEDAHVEQPDDIDLPLSATNPNDMYDDPEPDPNLDAPAEHEHEDYTVGSDNKHDTQRAAEAANRSSDEYESDRMADEHSEAQSTDEESASLQGDGPDIKHLSDMVLKLVKQYNIRSIADFPCKNNVQWFPKLLEKIDFEIPGFSYYCVAESSNNELESYFSTAGSPQFLSLKPEHAKRLPQVDMVFSWGGPQEWGVERSWTFFSALREVRPNYILVTNNGVESNVGDQKGVNLRKQPFHFARALRVISDVDRGETPMHLLLYEIDGVRKGF